MGTVPKGTVPVDPMYIGNTLELDYFLSIRPTRSS
jgi:hypothetical protein